MAPSGHGRARIVVDRYHRISKPETLNLATGFELKTTPFLGQDQYQYNRDPNRKGKGGKGKDAAETNA